MAVYEQMDARWVIQEVLHRLESKPADTPKDAKPQPRFADHEPPPLFPRVKAMIGIDGDYYDALTAFADADVLSRYESPVDYLFCEIMVPGLKHDCQSYYRNRSFNLSRSLRPGEAEVIDQMLIVILEIIYAADRQRLKLTTQQVRELFNLAIQS